MILSHAEGEALACIEDVYGPEWCFVYSKNLCMKWGYCF